jgi:hypothetical protein
MFKKKEKEKEQSKLEKKADIYSYKYIEALTTHNCLQVANKDTAKDLISKFLVEFAQDILNESIELAEIEHMNNLEPGVFYSKTITQPN